MGHLFKIFYLLACAYLAAGQINDDTKLRRAGPPILCRKSVVKALENVNRDYETIMTDIGEGIEFIGPPEKHLAKILNVVKQLTYSKFTNGYYQKEHYDEIVTEALSSNLHDIRTDFKHEMGEYRRLRLDLIQHVIDVVCKGVDHHECVVKVDKFFYEDVPDMEDKIKKDYIEAITTLFSLQTSFNNLLSRHYLIMKKFAKESTSQLYVHHHKDDVDSLVNQWLLTLRTLLPGYTGKTGIFYG